MIRSAKYAVGIVIAVLSLSLPQLLLAQDGLTLENLAESVQGLTSDFNIFARDLVRVNDRLDTLENQVAAFAEAQHYDTREDGYDDDRACIAAVDIYGNSRGISPTYRLRAETVNGYSEKYEKSMPGVGLVDVRIYPKRNIVEVNYTPGRDDLYILSVTERWQGCVFMGYEFEEREPRE